MFDLLDLLGDITRPVYDGPAPLKFTSRYFTPAQLLAATEEHDRGRHGWSADDPTSGMWRLGITTGWCGTAPRHTLCMLTTDLRCDCRRPSFNREGEPIGLCRCVGDLLYQANCPECSWHHVSDDENTAVEAWHDHAWPGWRDLPLIPRKLRTAINTQKTTAALTAWLEENYPPEFRVDGAPVLTDRDGIGTRSVPRRSPYGGYDIARTPS